MNNATQTESNRERNARQLASHAPLLLQQAVDIIEQRLQQQPQNNQLWFKLGNTYRGLGKLDNACTAFQQALDNGYG